MAAAHRRGVTRRWTGLTAMTSMAAISSRILRLPRSAVMAEPPAPAMSSAVATGAASRTMASTMAAPVARLGAELAVERADVQGDDHAERDRDEDHREAGDLGDEPALAEVLLPPVRRRPTCGGSPSRETANMLPVSRTTNWTLPSIVPPPQTVMISSPVMPCGREPPVFPVDQLLLDVALLGGQLVHADRALGPARRGTGG